MRRIAATAEIITVGRHPVGCFETGFHILLIHLPMGFDGGIARLVAHGACRIQRGGTTIDQMYESASRCTLRTLASHALYSLRTPIGADIREHDTFIGQQMSKEHRHAIEKIIFSGKDVCLARAVPVKRCAHHRFRKIEIRLVVGPLALALNTRCNGVVPDGLFLIAHFQQFRRALHQVADNHHVFHRKLPILVFFLAILSFSFSIEGGHGRTGEQRTVFVIVMPLLWFTILFYPCHGFFKLLFVVNTKVNASKYLYQRHILRTHTKILLQEIGIDNTTGDTHASVANREVRLTTHGGYGLSCTRKTKYFLRHIFRYRIVVQILHIMAINAVCRQSLLSVCSKHSSKINSTRPFCAIESPNSFGIIRIHVHRLRAIAPAGCDSDCRTDAFTLELLSACSTFTHTADGGIADDTLNKTAVAISEI